MVSKTKKQLREEQYKKVMEKNLEIAWAYPFCKRCKEKLEPLWAKALKKKKHIPLCRKCFEPMMKQYKENLEKFQKMMSR